MEISRLSCRVSIGLSRAAAAFAGLLAQAARMLAQVSIPNPIDFDGLLFCKCAFVEMAFLGTLPVHVIEPLKFAI